MKKLILLLFSLPFLLPVFGQNESKKEEAFYMLDANFKGTQQEKDKYFIYAEKIHDSCWQFDKYNISGPLLNSEQYKNEKGTGANGVFTYYNKKGSIDSTGNYQNDLQDGTWYFISETGKYLLQKEYKLGDLLSVKDLTKKENTNDKKENKKSERTETESVFPGGLPAWTNYLSSNMVYPQRAQNLPKQGTVIIQFIVNEDGHVTSPQIAQSIEYSLDQEALRLVKQSPVWTPAVQDGKKVKSYKKQPVSFKLE